MTPTRDGTATKGERTRARLVEVAARAFAERGYAATTFGDLIEAAGVSKGAFYFHFQSKEQLALAVLADVKGRHLDAVRKGLAEAPPGAGALRVIAQTLLALGAQEPAGSLSLAHELASSLAASPQLRDEASAVTRRWLDLLAGVVADGRRTGSVRSDLDPDLVARVLFAAVDGSRRLVDALDAPADRHAAFAAQVELLLLIAERGLG